MKTQKTPTGCLQFIAGITLIAAIWAVGLFVLEFLVGPGASCSYYFYGWLC